MDYCILVADPIASTFLYLLNFDFELSLICIEKFDRLLEENRTHVTD